jgi:hypothetical protein
MHRKKSSHHYVFFDDLTDYSDDGMLHYTLHRYKGAHHYVRVRVSVYCTPYYEVHINLDAHPYAFHRNVCIYHCVHEVVHLRYPGKNTKSKISLHSDRKNSHFYSIIYIK